MPPIPDTGPAEARARWLDRGTILFVLLFWVAHLLGITAQVAVMNPEWLSKYMLLRIAVMGAGALISFGVAWLLRRYDRHPLRRRLWIAAVVVFVASILHSAASYGIAVVLVPEEPMTPSDNLSYIVAIFRWFWSYAAFAALLMAFTYNTALREQQQRVAQLQRVAHAAHLRALQYQLNPHFMFNTLNSIAALIGQRDPERAETMVENLADFLRACLAIDPNEDITLAREIELQSLYLAIEQVRFPDRLRIEIDVPAELRKAPVPSLVTQPLIENAVKHAVARSTRPVTIAIRAHEEAGRLHLSVRDSGGEGAAPAPRGSAVGLANVAERLTARYGEDCRFAAGPLPGGGFEARFAIPFAPAPPR